MVKTVYFCLLVIIAAVMAPGCNGTVQTGEFIEMLGYIPASFPAEHDILYGNTGKVLDMYGIENVEDIDELGEIIRGLPGDEGKELMRDLSATMLAPVNWNRPEIHELTGFQPGLADRVICGNINPPNGYYILQGEFDENLISQKLTDQGYMSTNYGKYSCLGIREDMEMDIRNPLGRWVLASMNRVAVLDNMLIIAPRTGDVTGILDAMSGKTPSALENDACKALAGNLGDVLSAVITAPERIISNLTKERGRPDFNFNIPEDWGQLRGYEMAAMGYRTDGDNRFFDIALYYVDKDAAEADGELILKRMNDYMLNTWHEDLEDVPFTARLEPGSPTVKKYGEGALLKISCTVLTIDDRTGILPFIGGIDMPFRDLLFLAIEPEEYTKTE